jgi:predicted dehydrogenase
LSGNRKIDIGVIGCGQRLRTLCGHLLGRGSVRLAALYDPDQSQVERFLEECGCGGGRPAEAAEPPETPQPLICQDISALLDSPEIEWVLIGSPNRYHLRQTAEAVRRGKHVFLEKPLAVSTEECLELARLHRHSDRRIVTGFVLRYSPLYRRMRGLLEAEDFGPVLTIQANENIAYEHAAYIARGWRRRRDIAGPHILEKCVHDIDLIQWMAGGSFTRIAATGDRAIFDPQHAGLYSEEILRGWERMGNLDNPDPFAEGEVSIEDRVQLLGELDNGVIAQFSAVAGAAVPERRIAVHCLRGSVIGELYSETLRYRTMDMPEERLLSWSGGGLHGGGDGELAAQLAAAMTDEDEPPVDLEEGIRANIAALAAEEARLSGEWVDLRPYWRELDGGGRM